MGRLPLDPLRGTYKGALTGPTGITDNTQLIRNFVIYTAQTELITKSLLIARQRLVPEIPAIHFTKGMMAGGVIITILRFGVLVLKTGKILPVEVNSVEV